MPQSRSRKKNHGYHPHRNHQGQSSVMHSSTSAPVRKNTELFFASFFGFMGVVIGFFMFDNHWAAVLGGAVIGAAIGYFIGRLVTRARA
ncbi:hypothetical protein C3K47_12850 [Solitalea longa]|uniref:Uncharacterized protein n=1 Tax=Solitalea longa TaxID=2079460 RepID=A0A2S5A0G2_9SPHI|nr:hypothetical protein [Solitalea longa]POY36081.1 hypothetical protein C3K47_12850 [Solitalea longa]